MEEWWLGDGMGRESEGRLTPWTGGLVSGVFEEEREERTVYYDSALWVSF